MSATITYDELLSQNQELLRQLEETNDTIEAIRTGQVDALIVKAGGEHELYTLKSADQTYRIFIEKMAEGALTLDHKGTILYSNSRFAFMIGLPLEKVIGMPFETFVPEAFKAAFTELIKAGWVIETKGEISLINSNHQNIPFLLSISALPLNEEASLSIILTDLTSQKKNRTAVEAEERAIGRSPPDCRKRQ